MPIAFSKYIDIVSAVGGAAQATGRDLILRLMTTNILAPTETVVEFETIEEVGAYFGTTSEEFLQAQFYFAFVSKLATSPSRISFARYSLSDVAPTIFGEMGTYATADFAAIADATFTITLGVDTEPIVVDFTSPLVTSLTEVATAIEDAIQAANGASVFTGCTVTYNPVTARFEFVGGAVGDLPIAIVPTGSGTDLSPIVGWVDPPAVFSDGIVGTTLTAFLIAQDELTNNFGSFAFVDAFVDDADILEVVTWSHGENVKYMYLDRVTATNAAAVAGSIASLSSGGLTLYDAALTTDFPWLLPAAIMAATPYARRAAVQNYMFQQAPLAALVTDTTLSGTYDAIRVNYYGNTQQGGDVLSFYQRGFLSGLPSAPVDMGVFANEIFLKDSIGVSIINLLLAVSAVPANDTGRAQVLAAIQAPIDVGLFNGTISVGKTLNSTQIAFITSVTGDDTAHIQIKNAGYWISAAVVEQTPNNFAIVYTLIYAKNDVIRKVEGSHLLI